MKNVSDSYLEEMTKTIFNFLTLNQSQMISCDFVQFKFSKNNLSSLKNDIEVDNVMKSKFPSIYKLSNDSLGSVFYQKVINLIVF